jgi:hypothetical protein
MDHGCKYNNGRRCSHLLAAFALICLSGTAYAEQGIRIVGTETCYPIGTDLKPTATYCRENLNNSGPPAHRSILFYYNTSGVCRESWYYPSSSCEGTVVYSQNGTSTYCNILSQKLANTETCTLQNPNCSLRAGQSTVISTSNMPSSAMGSILCYDYCEYQITLLFSKNPETGLYDAAFIDKTENNSNCYAYPPLFENVIGEENQIPPEEQPGLPTEPLPSPTYSVTPENIHINGQIVSIYPESGCSLLSGGGFICVAGDTPPNGNDGQPTHGKTGGLVKENGDSFDYFSPLPSTGLTGTGQGPGGSVKDTTDGATYGGDDCKTPPVCTGNEIQCAQLRQLWLARCPVDGSDPTTIDGEIDKAQQKLTQKLGLQAVNIADLIDWSPDASQNYFCPAPLMFSTPSWGSFEWKLDPICTLAERLRAYFLMLIRIIAILIFVRSAKG